MEGVKERGERECGPEKTGDFNGNYGEGNHYKQKCRWIDLGSDGKERVIAGQKIVGGGKVHGKVEKDRGVNIDESANGKKNQRREKKVVHWLNDIKFPSFDLS